MYWLLDYAVALQTSCENFSNNLQKETALKRVLRNLLSAIPFAQI